MSLLTKGAPNSRSGIVLVMVLGITMVAAWLAIEVLANIRKELTLNSAPKNEAKLQQTAYQLLEISIGVLAEIKQFEGALYSPAQGWGFPLSYAGMTDTPELAQAAKEYSMAALQPEEAEDSLDEAPAGEGLLNDLLSETDSSIKNRDGYVRDFPEITPPTNVAASSIETAKLALPSGLQARVRLYDESGKLSLSATKPARWILFFKEMGFEESESKSLTDALLDWMDPDDQERENGAETLTYSQLDPPYIAPNRTLRDFEELRYLNTFKTSFFNEKGLPNAYFTAFKQNVSRYHNDEVNANSASELILKTLAEEKNFDADSVINFLAGADLTFGTEDDRILRPGLEETDLPKDDTGEPIQLIRPVRYIHAEIAVSDGQSIYYLNSILDLQSTHPGGVYPFKIVRIVENQPIS